VISLNAERSVIHEGLVRPTIRSRHVNRFVALAEQKSLTQRRKGAENAAFFLCAFAPLREIILVFGFCLNDAASPTDTLQQ
jgi:hypothetical protein